MKIAPSLPPSGVMANYRLVKYRVINICKGRYEGENIIVDHFITDGDEHKDIEVGSRVYIPIVESEKIDSRFNFEGILI